MEFEGKGCACASTTRPGSETGKPKPPRPKIMYAKPHLMAALPMMSEPSLGLSSSMPSSALGASASVAISSLTSSSDMVSCWLPFFYGIGMRF